MVCHHLNSSVPEDVSFAESRITWLKQLLQKMFFMILVFLSMISSDSQAMGRVGEVTTRTWQAADKMKKMTGKLKDEDSSQTMITLE